MRGTVRTVIAAVLGIASGVLLGAQSTAVRPAPRTTDGHPDLTGVYQASTRRGTLKGNDKRLFVHQDN